MNITSTNSNSAGAPNPERLARMRKAATDLESVFINEILKAARPKGGMLDKSFAAQTFQDMLGQKLAQDMSEKGVFGFADSMTRQLMPAETNLTAAKDTLDGKEEHVTGGSGSTLCGDSDAQPRTGAF